MEEKKISPMKAIRLKCLDCCCGSANEVKLCTVTKCPLYPFRDGHNPYIKKREYTEEQREAQRSRMTELHSLMKQRKTENGNE